MINITPIMQDRLVTIIKIREGTLENLEAACERLPEDHWKRQMYESLIDSYIESISAIDEVLDALDLDWETDPEGNVRLIERSEENA